MRFVSCLHFVTFACNTGAVNQKIERLESSKQSTEDKVNLLQGDYSNYFNEIFLL